MQNTAMLMPTSHFHYVYILRDVATGKRHYTGVTHDLQERLAMHNAGHVPHTSKLRLGKPLGLPSQLFYCVSRHSPEGALAEAK